VDGVKLPHFLIWCFAGAARTGARLSPFRGFLRRGLCRHRRDGLMQQSPSLGGVGDVRVIAAGMGYWPSQSVESISTAATGRAAVGPSPGRLVSASS